MVIPGAKTQPRLQSWRGTHVGWMPLSSFSSFIRSASFGITYSLHPCLPISSIHSPSKIPLVGLCVRTTAWRNLAARVVKVKVKFSHTRYRALGPELIPVYRQSARR